MSTLDIKPLEGRRTHGAQRRKLVVGAIKAQQSLEININRAVALSHHESLQHRLMLDFCLFSKAYASGTIKDDYSHRGFIPLNGAGIASYQDSGPVPHIQSKPANPGLWRMSSNGIISSWRF